MKYSTDDLIEQFRSGNDQVFALIFKYYYNGLCAYSYTFLKNHDESEEIVQEFFTELWANRDLLNVRTSFKLYLYRGVHNKCINYLKSHAVAQKRLEKYAWYTQTETEMMDIDTESEEYERFFSESFENDIQEAIESLAPQQRHIFTMSRFHQKSYADIASELNISINSVKTQMSRALQKLRALLTEKLGKHPLILLFMGLQAVNYLRVSTENK